MKFTIPKPPSVNHLYGLHGHIKYITRAGKEWFEEAGWRIREQTTIGVPMRECEIKMTAYIIQGDWDNLLKATFDLMTKMGIVEDDKFIMKGIMEKVVVHHRKDEHLDIEIYAQKETKEV